MPRHTPSAERAPARSAARITRSSSASERGKAHQPQAKHAEAGGFRDRLPRVLKLKIVDRWLERTVGEGNLEAGDSAAYGGGAEERAAGGRATRVHVGACVRGSLPPWK